jgi:four helix bundle protein
VGLGIGTEWDCPLCVFEVSVGFPGYLSRQAQFTYLRMQLPEGPLARQLAMRDRTRDFALETARLCESIPSTMTARHIAGQLLRCSTSVAANYRAACRSRSRKEFIAKIGVVLEEADESLFWLEFAQDLGLFSSEGASNTLSEANQLVAIFSATRSTALARFRSGTKETRSIPKS